jgi:hypothetical protein
VSLKGAQEQIEPTADFADAFIDAIARSEKSELAMRDGEEKERFKTRILSLLTIERLSISAKAISLIIDYEHTFCRARIITDFRPIFEDVGKKPVAGLIVHTLRLTYHQKGELQHIYVEMDDSELKELRAHVDRAEAKAVSLRDGLTPTQIPIVPTGGKK